MHRGGIFLPRVSPGVIHIEAFQVSQFSNLQIFKSNIFKSKNTFFRLNPPRPSFTPDMAIEEMMGKKNKNN